MLQTSIENSGDYVELHPEEEGERKPWLRLVVMVLSCAVASGLCPGAAVWISLLAEHEVFSHSCGADYGTFPHFLQPNTTDRVQSVRDNSSDYLETAVTLTAATLRKIPCDDQYLALGLVFSNARMFSSMFVLVAGLMFDAYGGRKVGTMGGIMVFVGFVLLQICLWGPSVGLDEVTAYLLPPLVILIDAGSVCNSQSALAILFHFPNIASVIIALLNATVDVAAILPIIVEVIMQLLGATLEQCLLFWAVGIAASTFCFWWYCPTQQEYLEYAEKVMGQKFDARSVSLWKVFYDGHRLLYENLLNHCCTIVLLALAAMWTIIYTTDVSDFAQRLFYYDANAASKAASIVVVVVAINGIFTPVATYMGERMGLSFLVLTGFVACLIASMTMLYPNWILLTITSFAAVYLPEVGHVLLSLRAKAYAPPNKFGTISGLHSLYFSLTTMILITIAQVWMGRLPDPLTRFEQAFESMIAISLGSLLVYLVVFYFSGLPSSPVLLPEEVESVCRHYGCKKLEDIAYIVHCETGVNTSEFRSRIATVDLETHEHMVLSIDRERMAKKMNELRVENFGKAMLAEFEWRRDLTKVDMNQNVSNLANMRNVLNRVADLSKFGKGSAKTVDQFESEVAKGRSKLVAASDGKMTRLVSLVALRIYNNTAPSKKVLVQVAEKFADGRERPKLQLPGTKMGPDDSLETCVKKICRKIGMSASSATFSYDDVEVSEQKLESPSYPGVFTIYTKSIVRGTVRAKEAEALGRLGLPACKPFTMQSAESKMMYMFEWMGEAEAKWRLSDAEAAHETGTPAPNKENGKPKTYWNEAEEEVRSLGKLRSVGEIMWSLQVRELTKRLLFLFATEDREGFETWLLTEPVDNIRNALADAAEWLYYDAAKVFKQFHEMVSHDDLIAILRNRQVLQPVIVELFMGDLEREQNRIRKDSSSKHRFCRNDHPLWPCSESKKRLGLAGKVLDLQEKSWTCDQCGESFDIKKEGLHFGCSRCKLDICKWCSEKDGLKRSKRKSMKGLMGMP